MSPERYNHPRVNGVDLTLEKRATRLDFERCGIAILGWAVFDNIGNKHVSTRKTCAEKQCIEHAS
jgi:hypothetical protein